MSVSQKQQSRFVRIRPHLPWILIVLVVGFLVILGIMEERDQPQIAGNGADVTTDIRDGYKAEWIKIDYSGLVDREPLTHSGQTVGEVLQALKSLESARGVAGYADQTNSLRGLLQPYLEPFSLLCNDAIAMLNGADSISLVNIVDLYPIGSEQPAYIALFREGHYQLYFSNNLIRIFVHGDNPRSALINELYVLRHPIRDILSTEGIEIRTVEIYCFQNKYEATQVDVNVSKLSLGISEVDLRPRAHPLDLASLQDFFLRSPLPEALEVDENSNLYVYGRLGKTRCTLSGVPLSLSDFAVAYRAVFHCASNEPYISLDKHEDNRFAKVNLGGHLEDTHVGGVLYEADRAFKTLSTGVNPRNHETISSKIKSIVPGFLTEDERSLREEMTEGHSQIRYWFYPDSLSTVTDGSIGAIRNSQFWAGVERMDIKTTTGKAQQQTISHLNENYYAYASALPILQELDVVGRLTALFAWAQALGVEKNVDLAALLSVKLPTSVTPRKTPKLLVSSSRSLNSTGWNPSPSKVVTKDLSGLVEKASPSLSDSQFILLGSNSTEQQARALEIEMKEIEGRLTRMQDLYDNKSNELLLRERYLNQYDQRDVDSYNQRVEELNGLGKQLKRETEKYNGLVARYNKFNRFEIVSVGGGIDMRPKDLKAPRRESNAIEIQRVRDSRELVRSAVPRETNWIRSKSGAETDLRNPLNSAKFASLQKSMLVGATDGNLLRVPRSALGGSLMLRKMSDGKIIATPGG